MSKKFKEALEEMRSSDLEMQTNGIESLVGYIANSIFLPPVLSLSPLFILF